jgi:hypothetical protein
LINFLGGMDFYVWKLFNFYVLWRTIAEAAVLKEAIELLSKFFSGVDTLVHSIFDLEDMERNR